MTTLDVRVDDLDAPQPSPGRSWRRANVVGLVLASVALFVACGWFFSLYHHQPASYHPDEPGKALQILNDTRNFNHPQLMLEVTDGVTRWLGTPPNVQDVVEVGRCVSADFGALGIVALALTGYFCGRWWGFVIVAVVTALCPYQLAHSRYLKEEPALVMGMGLVVLASKVYWDARVPWRRLAAAAFLGLACAVAVSGKYFGVVGLALAIPVLLLAAPRTGWRAWWQRGAALLIFLVVGAGVFYAINYRAFDSYDAARRAMDVEIVHVTTVHGGATMKTPSPYFWGIVDYQTPTLVKLMAGLFVVHLLWRRRRGRPSAWNWCLLLFCGVVAIVVSYCAIPVSRYALPIIVCLFLMAGLGVVYTIRLLPPGRWRFAGGAIMLGMMLWAQLPPSLEVTRQFRDDNRQLAREWILKNVPEGATILAGWCTNLADEPYGTPPDGFQQKYYVTGIPFTSVQSLRRMGENVYIAVDNITYEHCLNPYVLPAPGGSQIPAGRAFFNELFTTDLAELVWQSPPLHRTQSHYSLVIKIYRLKPNAAER